MRVLLLMLFLASTAVTSSAALPSANRGTQLFVLITGRPAADELWLAVRRRTL